MTPAELKRLRENQLNAKHASEARGFRPPQFAYADDDALQNRPKQTRQPYRSPVMISGIDFVHGLSLESHDQQYTIELPLPPSVNDWKTPIGKGRAILTKPYREWRKRAHMVLGLFGQSNGLLRGPLDVALVFRFADISSDIDGRIKPLFDAANATLWVDDKHVGHLTVEKLITGPNETPHVKIVVSRVRFDGAPWDAELVKRLERAKK